MRGRLALLATAWSLSACAPIEPLAPTVWLPSRGTSIPATLIDARPGAGEALVIMAHGHGGDRDSADGFTRLATRLAKHQISSIRMDFPGCGESREPFEAHHLTHLLRDLASARDYALQYTEADASKVAVVGYSMGGRVAILATVQDSYAGMVLWAPVATNGAAAMFDFFGGRAAFDQHNRAATATGVSEFVTQWGQRQRLSKQWFDDLADSNPLEALQQYAGPVLILHGTDDNVIAPEVSQAVTAARPSTQLIWLDNTGHGLGFYDDQPAIAAKVVEETTTFLANALQ